MDEFEKLSSPINRCILKPLTALREFWEELPIDYIEWQTTADSEAEAILTEQCERALSAAVSLVNRLTALRACTAGLLSAGSRVKVLDSGFLSQETESFSLIDELLDFSEEERKYIVSRVKNVTTHLQSSSHERTQT